MAGNRYITGGTSGVWTAATTGAFKWNDYETLGLPNPDEDVYANNKTVYINSNINVKSLNTLSAAGIAAGGGFSITAGTPSINICATTINAGTLSCLTNNTTNTINIIGSLSGSATNTAHALVHGSTGIVSISGNCIGSNNGSGIVLNAAGSIYISGNSIISVGGAAAIRNDAGNIYAIANLISGGTNAAGHGIINQTSGQNIFVTGNTRGGTGASGGSGLANTVANSNIYVLGNVSGGSVSSSNGIESSVAGIISVTGDCYSSLFSSAIENTSQSGLLTVIGNVYNLNGISAIYSYNLKISPTTPQSFILLDNTATSASTIFSTSAYTNTLPLPQDVRSGYTYGFLSGLTGTCVIPPSQSVSVGVKVDNGSGVTTSGTSINRIIEAGAMYASFGVSGY